MCIDFQYLVFVEIGKSIVINNYILKLISIGSSEILTLNAIVLFVWNHNT